MLGRLARWLKGLGRHDEDDLGDPSEHVETPWEERETNFYGPGAATHGPDLSKLSDD